MKNSDWLLVVAWGIAMFNLGRIITTQPLDVFGLVISVAVILGAPILGVMASRS